MSPSFPADPRMEMSEAQYQGYLQLDDLFCALPRPSDTLIDFYERLYGTDSLRAGFSLNRRLRGEVWRTREGEEMTVEQMGLSHAQSLIRWLERRAKLIHLAARVEMACIVSDHDGGEHAHDSLEQEEAELNAMDPLDYLRETNLYQQLTKKINGEEPKDG